MSRFVTCVQWFVYGIAAIALALVFLAARFSVLRVVHAFAEAAR